MGMVNKMIENKELTRLIRGCKTSQDLHELQIAFANETIGRITDKQALRILEAKNKMEEKEKMELIKKRKRNLDQDLYDYYEIKDGEEKC